MILAFTEEKKNRERECSRREREEESKKKCSWIEIRM